MSSIYGMGNPLMDIILRGTQQDLEALGVEPGSMNLVSYREQLNVIERCRGVSWLPGGSCANTARAAAWIAAQRGDAEFSIHYVGAVGEDRFGDEFARDLDSAGVGVALARKQSATGSSAIVVTPDFERTMFTYLGACRELDQADLNLEAIAGSTIFHVTGYMWDAPNQESAAGVAAQAARRAGAVVSFDVADPFVAERYGARLRAWLPRNCDILFANRAELQSLTGVKQPDAAVLEAAAALAPHVVMKIGADGCLVRSAAGTVSAAGERVEATDSTGAGDSFAGGYLYGIARGWPIERCARLANRIAAAVVGVEGCRYDGLDSRLIQDFGD